MQLLLPTKLLPSIVTSRATFVCTAALALSLACSDDSKSDTTGGGGSGGSNAGSAGSGAGKAGSAGATAGKGGGAGAAGAPASGKGGSGGANAGSAGKAGGAGAGGNGGSGGAAGAGGAVPDAGALAFTISSPAFDNNEGCGPDDDEPAACDLFPADNTGLNGARDVSPQIDWEGAPAGTQSFAIAFHDLSNVNGGDPFTHWALWNIPGTATGLPAELAAGPGVPGANSQQVSFRNNARFAGSGQAGNVYEFVLYALDTATFTPSNANSADAVQSDLDDSDAVLGTARMRARSAPPQ